MKVLRGSPSGFIRLRRYFLVASTLGVSALAMRLRAESNSNPRRVGIVYPEPTVGPEYRRGWAAFDEELRQRGWEEGRNIVFERRYFYGNRARLTEVMAELVALDVDVLFVQGAFAVFAARQASERIPIVFAVGDAVGRGVVTNLARPDGNATGVSNRNVDITAKVVELLTQISPGVSRIAALMNTDAGYPPALFDEPRRRGVEVFIVDLRSRRDIGPAMATVVKRRAGAILAGSLKPPFQADLIDAVATVRLPAAWPGRLDVELGGLFSLERDLAYNHRRVAVYIDKILRGARPVDLPVEQPAVYELAINLKTAKALGITIPRELIVRADWIVE